MHFLDEIDATDDGLTITLNDGTTTKTFELDPAGDGVASGNVQVSGAGIYQVSSNLAAAISAAGMNLQAVAAGATVLIWADSPSVGTAANNAIVVANDTAGKVEVWGLLGGKDTGQSWEVTLGTDFQTRRIPVVIDDDNRALIPMIGPVSGHPLRRILGSSGSTVWEFTLSGAREVRDLALVPPDKEFNPSTVTGSEFVFVGSTTGSSGTGSNVSKLRLIAEEEDSSVTKTREVRVYAVCGGSVYRVDPVSATQIGVGSLSSTAPWIASAVVGRNVYMADGRRVIEIDTRTDTISELDTKGPGTVPKGAQLLAAWRGRLVLARLYEGSTEYAMSAIGDPHDWDTQPPVPNAAMAFTGRVQSGAGSPDTINALIPYNDDVLLFGCDSSIWQLSGDPVAGGEFDLVTDVTGMAYGLPATKDPRGRLWFFGSRGGLYVMAPGTPPQRVSQFSIERRLQDIDLSQSLVRLVYDHRQEGLHLFVVTRGSGGTVLSSYFYDIKHGGWWEDVFGSASVQPASAAVYDGDEPDDRVVLIGSEDGYIREIDETASTDDGVVFDTEVLIGPLVPASSDGRYRFGNARVVLSEKSGPVLVEMRVGDSGLELGRLVRRWQIGPGRNNANPARAAGNAVWLGLRSRSGKPWAFESASVDVSPAGRARVER